MFAFVGNGGACSIVFLYPRSASLILCLFFCSSILLMNCNVKSFWSDEKMKAQVLKYTRRQRCLHSRTMHFQDGTKTIFARYFHLLLVQSCKSSIRSVCVDCLYFLSLFLSVRVHVCMCLCKECSMSISHENRGRAVQIRKRM